jgi:hypothetical protein
MPKKGHPLPQPSNMLANHGLIDVARPLGSLEWMATKPKDHPVFPRSKVELSYHNGSVRPHDNVMIAAG